MRIISSKPANVCDFGDEMATYAAREAGAFQCLD